MASRTKLRQEMERMKVMEEEKSHTNGIPKVINNNFHLSSFKNTNEPLSYGGNYLPNINYSVTNVNPNYEYSESYSNNSNNPNNIMYNPDMQLNCFDLDEILPIENAYHGRNDSPYMFSPVCQYDKFNMDQIPYESANFPLQYRDASSKSLLQNYEINNKNEFSLSCPVTGEQSDVCINHAISSCNFPPNPSPSVQVQYPNDNMKNLKDRKKESHNRIERKRRDYINQQINELGKLVPSEINSDNESKKNKGNILKNSVEYVTRLKNEFNNISNYIKETELAFILIESYRKRNQELENQIKTYSIPNTESENQNLVTNYNNYLILHEQNQRNYQSNGKMVYPKSTKSNSTDLNRQLRPIKDKQLSPLDGQIAFKIEPSSAHSSGGNNSLSTTYRIEEEADTQFISQDVMNIRTSYQISNNNHPSLPSMHNDSFFSSNTHYRCMDSHKFESMEC